MHSPHLLVEEPEVGVRLLRLNRPRQKNALSTPLLSSLAQALGEADSDPTVRCAVITGSAVVFAAGADIGEMASKDTRGGLDDVRVDHWRSLRAVRKPIVAAVNGWCLGAGNELLMCCDLVIAGEDARFGQPEINLGIMPGAGGTSLLPRLVGRTRAMRMVLLGDPMDAREAWQAGLVNEVVAPAETLPTALRMARRLAAQAPLAIHQAKASVKAALETTLSPHHTLERQAFSITLGSDDKAEGVSAFLEKRAPAWTGR